MAKASDFEGKKPEELFYFVDYSPEEAERIGYSNYSYWGSTLRIFWRNRVARCLVILLIALLAVVSIVTLALFAARACRVGRSAFYTIAACAAGCGLIAYGGWWLIAVGAACVLFAFLYTAGPYPLAYHGWGDMLVLLFFGFVPVGCTYYVLCGGWTWQVAVLLVWNWQKI